MKRFAGLVYLLPTLIMMAVGFALTRSWFWIIAPPILLLGRMVYGTMVDMRNLKYAERLYQQLQTEGLSPLECLVEISRRRHPELAYETHATIIETFPDLYQFLGFMAQAADFGRRKKLDDQDVLALLETTTLTYQGQGVYTADIDWERYRSLLTPERQQAKGGTR